MSDDELLTTKQAAEALGVNDSRVRQLARAGILPAQRVGRDWMIRRGDLAIARTRKTQRGPSPASSPESTEHD